MKKKNETSLQALDKTLSFLVIGQLRKSKHVPFTIEAFRLANMDGAMLKLIGRAHDEYEKEIQSAISNDKRIIRKNAFLEYGDFNKHFSKSHFVVFADEQGPSCITNGTMTEALINHRPIICPNYNPYKYYIEKYNIGLMYEAGNVDSYAATMRKARDLGVEYFQYSIDQFLKTLSFDVVAKKLVEDLKRS